MKPIIFTCSTINFIQFVQSDVFLNKHIDKDELIINHIKNS